MCEYYAHIYQCKHQTYTFARYCKPASLIQTPCSLRGIWAKIDMDGVCDECPERVYVAPKTKQAMIPPLHGGFAKRT